MIKHHILVKWNASVCDKKALLKDIQSIFNKLLVYPEIHSIEYSENVINRPNRYDLMICIKMEDDFLKIYDVSEAHKEWKEKYGKFLENKAIFDSEA
jgi:hypothetical protein